MYYSRLGDLSMRVLYVLMYVLISPKNSDKKPDQGANRIKLCSLEGDWQVMGIKERQTRTK